MGGIDILANVAGGMTKLAQWRPLIEWTDDAWDTITHLNLRYVFWMCRAAIPQIEARGGGAIVNVASMMGLSGGGPYPNASYHASKGAVANLTVSV